MTLHNVKQIIKLYSQDRIRFIDTSDTTWHLSAEKGDPIFYLFPRFGRPKYYSEDMYTRLFDDGVYTKQEMNDIIRRRSDFKTEHLFEEDGTIYREPRVVVNFADGSTTYKYFDTLQLCEEYISELKSNYPFLIEL